VATQNNPPINPGTQFITTNSPATSAFPLSLIRRRIPNIQRLKMKPGKHPPNIRMVIDADHHLALTPAHEVGHALVVFKREVDAVARRLPVRRVHVMEGVGSVVAFGAVEPGEVFDVRACEALPGAGEVFLNAQQVNGHSSLFTGEGLVLLVDYRTVLLDADLSRMANGRVDFFRALIVAIRRWYKLKSEGYIAPLTKKNDRKHSKTAL